MHFHVKHMSKRRNLSISPKYCRTTLEAYLMLYLHKRSALLCSFVVAMLANPISLRSNELSISAGYVGLITEAPVVGPDLFERSPVDSTLSNSGAYYDIPNPTLDELDHIVDRFVPRQLVTISGPTLRIVVRNARDFQSYVGYERSHAYQQGGQIRFQTEWNESLRNEWATAITSALESTDNGILSSEDYWRQALDDWASREPTIGRTLKIGMKSYDTFHNLVIHARRKGTSFRPFVTGGVGLVLHWMGLNKDVLQGLGIKIDDDPSFIYSLIPANVSLAYNYGGGVKYNRSKFGIRFDVRNRVIFRQFWTTADLLRLGKMNNLEFSVGFTFLRDQGGVQ